MFHLYGGETVRWESSLIVKTPFYNFFTEVIKLDEIRTVTGEVSDFYDRIGFLGKLMTDPVYEGKKRGYNRAAREYTYAFSKIEQQYNTAKEFYQKQRNTYDFKADTFIQMLEELEKQRKYLEKQVTQRTHDASSKTGISVPSIISGFSGIGYASFSSSSTVYFKEVPSIFDRRLNKAEKEGYLEARNEFLNKIEALKQDLKELRIQGDKDIKKYQDMIDDILCDITTEQLKIADLSLLI